jgi:hypothetical protein
MIQSHPLVVEDAKQNVQQLGLSTQDKGPHMSPLKGQFAKAVRVLRWPRVWVT